MPLVFMSVLLNINASATLAFQGTVLPAMLSMLVLILKLILEIALQMLLVLERTMGRPFVIVTQAM